MLFIVRFVLKTEHNIVYPLNILFKDYIYDIFSYDNVALLQRIKVTMYEYSFLTILANRNFRTGCFSLNQPI